LNPKNNRHSGARFPFPSFPPMRESIVDTVKVDPAFAGMTDYYLGLGTYNMFWLEFEWRKMCAYDSGAPE
jgi:hypothetical protein